MSEYGTKVYHKAGGVKLIVADGGEIEIQSGGTLDVQSGATLDFDGNLSMGSDDAITFGDSNEVAVEFDTAQTQDCLQIGVDATSRTIMILEKADMSVDKAVAASTYPQVIIYDADADNYMTLGSSGDDVALVGSSNDIDVRCGLVAADALNLQAYDVNGGAYEDMVTLASHATTPTMVLHASGGITMNAAIVASDDGGTGAGSIVTVEGEDLGLQSTDATTAGAGGDVNIIAGAADTAGTGGDVDIDAGAALGANVGGAVELTAGAGGAAGAGGPITILAGAPASGAADGGDISVTGGAAGATLGTGGDVSLVGGASPTSGTGGDINITAGASSTTGAGGAVDIDAGASGGANVGGDVEIAAGAGGAGGAGGAIDIDGGAPASGDADGGAIEVDSGTGSGTGDGGAVTIQSGASGGGATGDAGDIAITGGNAASTAGDGGSVTITAGDLTGGGADGIVSFVTGGNVVSQAGGSFVVTNEAGAGAGLLAAVAGQDLTITAGNDMLMRAGPLASDVLKLQAYDLTVGYDDNIVITSATDPTVVVQADGGITLNGAIVISDATGAAAGSISAVAGQSISINLGDNVATALDIQEATNDYITCVTTDDLEEIEFGKPVDMERGRKVSTYFEIFDDFLYQAITENDNPWILNAGTDTLAIDAAINAQENGVIRLQTGDASGATAADASQMVCHIPMQANNGGLVFETRLHINTAVTDISVNMGFTDATGLEEPFTIAAGAYTSTASDAAVFVYDTDATDDVFHMCAVDGDTDDTGCAAIAGTLPAADTFAVYRIEVSADGATIRYYIDGALEGTLTGDAGVSPDVNLYATVTVNATTTTSKTVDVDYIMTGVVRG